MTRPVAPEEPELHRAARRGDIATLERLHRVGADMDSRTDIEIDEDCTLRGLSPLMVAARSIDGATVETLKWLLEHGADLHAESEWGLTAAWFAAGRGGRRSSQKWQLVPEHVDRLRFLLDADGDRRGAKRVIDPSLLTQLHGLPGRFRCSWRPNRAAWNVCV